MRKSINVTAATVLTLVLATTAMAAPKGTRSRETEQTSSITAVIKRTISKIFRVGTFEKPTIPIPGANVTTTT